MALPREHFHKPIRDGSGILRQGVTARILEPNADVLISEPLYVDATGTATHPNPLVVEDGVLDFYLDQPRIVDIGLTPEGTTTETLLQDQWVGDAEYYKETFSFTLAGEVSVTTGRLRFYVEEAAEIEVARASLGVAPAGASVVVDVLKNGVTIFPDAPKPTVAAGQNTNTSVPDITALAAGDYLTVDITQVGTTTAGSDLVVQVRARRV